MNTDWITFGLAITAYALLAIDLLYHARGLRSKRWSMLTAVVVAAHVVCVWIFRLNLDPAAAFQKSPQGFIIFHAATILIFAGPFLPAVWWTRALAFSMIFVTIGAIAGTFRYPELAMLRIPVIAIALLKGGQALFLWLKSFKKQE